MALDKKDKLRFLEFLILATSLIGIIVAVNPSLMAVEGSPLPIPMVFILNLLTVIVSCLYLYGKVILGEKLTHQWVTYFMNYFAMTMALPFGSVVATSFGPYVSWSFDIFFLVWVVMSVIISLVVGLMIVQALADNVTVTRAE